MTLPQRPRPTEPARGWFPDLPNGATLRLTPFGAEDLGFQVSEEDGRTVARKGDRWFILEQS